MVPGFHHGRLEFCAVEFYQVILYRLRRVAAQHERRLAVDELRDDAGSISLKIRNASVWKKYFKIRPSTEIDYLSSLSSYEIRGLSFC